MTSPLDEKDLEIEALEDDLVDKTRELETLRDKVRAHACDLMQRAEETKGISDDLYAAIED